MLRNILLIACSIAIFIPASSQNRHGVKADIGISHMPHTFYAIYPNAWSRPGLTAQVGVFKELAIGEKGRLGFESLLTLNQGSLLIETVFLDTNVTEIGEGEIRITDRLLYLSLPVWYGLKFNRVTVQAGMQFSVRIAGEWRTKERYVLNGEEISNTGKGKFFSDNRFDFGPRAAAFYDLGDRWALEANFYYGLISVNTVSPPNHRRTLRSGLGVRFKI